MRGSAAARDFALSTTWPLRLAMPNERNMLQDMWQLFSDFGLAELNITVLPFAEAKNRRQLHLPYHHLSS